MWTRVSLPGSQTTFFICKLCMTMHVCVCVCVYVCVLDSFTNSSILVEYLLCTRCKDIVVSNKELWEILKEKSRVL